MSSKQFIPNGPTIFSSGNFNDLYVKKIQATSISGIQSNAAGSNTEVQFNNGGNLDASSNFTWNGTSLVVNNSTLGNSSIGFFGKTSSKQNIDNPSVEKIIEVLQNFGLSAINPWIQQGDKLIGTDAIGNAFQGTFISLSRDGNTLAIGGPNDNYGLGATWIYTKDNIGIWSQQGDKLVDILASVNARQGTSVSLSGDGNTLAVGGPVDNGDIGATWIYIRNAGVWTQQGKLIGIGYGMNPPNQGVSVSLSSDGNTLAVGGINDAGGVGATWIFTRDNLGVWTQQGSKLIGTNPNGLSGQGISIRLSDDGNTLAVGGFQDASDIGATWIFTRDNLGVWTQQGPKLVGTGYIEPVVYQGSSVSLSSDGNTLAVGGFGDNFVIGATWIFTRDNLGTWTQQGDKLIGSGYILSSYQGISVSLSDDGNTLAVGGQGNDSGVGASWIFTRNAGIWINGGFEIIGTGALGYSEQGTSVSLSGDGNTLAVGGPNDSSNKGATWIFYKN